MESTVGAAASITCSKRSSGATTAMARISTEPAGASNTYRRIRHPTGISMWTVMPSPERVVSGLRIHEGNPVQDGMPPIGLLVMARDPELSLACLHPAAGLRGPDPRHDAIANRVDLCHQLGAATQPDEPLADGDLTAEDGPWVHRDRGDEPVRRGVDVGHRSFALIHDPHTALTHIQEPRAETDLDLR